ncbi:MAG: hypothetical protein NTV63_04860 [Candidatus Woesearchaeota archaeon]|nr:hypothetical protein [Candidatus Woesearchaeota archaeon]
MDTPATAELIKWVFNGITLVLVTIASSLAAKKKQHIAILIVFVANAVALFVLLSPLLAWIASIVCIIRISSLKEAGQNEQSLKNPKPSTGNNKKAGNIIGLLLGIGFVAAPLIGYIRKEASFYDPNSQGWIILFALIGAFMIINNIFALLKKEENTQPAVTPIVQETKDTAEPPSKENPVAKKESEKSADKVRCRYCDKLYNANYNGCPYCKKK